MTTMNPLRVCCMLDPFSRSCFRDLCTLLPVSPDDRVSALAERHPDLLVVSTTSEEWKANPGKVTRMMRRLKERGIPSVFLAVSEEADEAVRGICAGIYQMPSSFKLIADDAAAAELYRRRFSGLMNAGRSDRDTARPAAVSVITCTVRDDYLDRVFANYARQTWNNKEMIVVLNNDSMNLERWQRRAESYEGVSVRRMPQERRLGACLNYGISLAKHDYIAKMDDDDYYGPNYLTDQLEALRRSNADIVGKKAFYVYFEKSRKLALMFRELENTYFNHLVGATLVFKKELCRHVRFDPDAASGSDVMFLNACHAKGYKLYASDKFNYVCHRRADKSGHTWKIDDGLLQSFMSGIVATDGDYVSTVSI